MIVRVTSKDLDHGKVGSTYHCPLARAFKRAYPGAALVRVSPTEIEVCDLSFCQKQPTLYIVMPTHLREWVASYDANPDSAPLIAVDTETGAIVTPLLTSG